MNIYEAIGIVLAVSPLPENATSDEEDAWGMCGSVADAYDALAPTPEQWAAHPWAHWVTMFDNGKLVWWELEPEARIMPNGEYAWTEKDGRIGRARTEQVSPLPEHIDWRNCKWKREGEA